MKNDNDNDNNLENNNNKNLNIENINNNFNNNNIIISSNNKDSKIINENGKNKNEKIKNIEEKRKHNKEKINKYLTYIKVQKYEETIKNDLDSLFTFITKDWINFWEKILFADNNIIENNSIQNADILSTEPNHKNQNIIKNDVARSRVRESCLIPGFTSILQSFIIYYVKLKKISYKQGLNEIIGPFLLIHYKLKDDFPFNKIYLFIEAFIDKFMTNYYINIDELIPLKESLSLFIILLKYHEPKIYNKLDNLMIEPTMYATNWIMTELSSKLKIDVLYVLWDFIIREKNILYFFILLWLLY